MKKIIIVGNSLAVCKLIEELSASEQEMEITLFTHDGLYPYDRALFPNVLSQEIPINKAFCEGKSFFTKHKVSVIQDQKITRINYKRKKIHTDLKKQFNYDVLVITEAPARDLSSIKGTKKDRVFGLTKLKELEQILKEVPLTESIVFQSDSIFGIQAALALSQKTQAEINVLTTKKSLISSALEDDVSTWLLGQFNEQGLRILQDTKVEEVLGDSLIKAVRLSSGKVIGCDMLIFPEPKEDLRVIGYEEIQHESGFPVDHNFCSKIEDVYAIDLAGILEGADVKDSSLSTKDLSSQARKVANKILNKEDSVHMSVYQESFVVNGATVSLLGSIEHIEGVQVGREFHQDAGSYKKVFLKGGKLIGAILINYESQKEDLMKMISEKIDIEGIDEYLETNDKPESELEADPAVQSGESQ